MTEEKTADKGADYTAKMMWEMGKYPIRAMVLFVIALILASMNKYGLTNHFLIALIIGALALSRGTVAASVFGISLLFAMFVISPSVLSALVAAAG